MANFRILIADDHAIVSGKACGLCSNLTRGGKCAPRLRMDSKQSRRSNSSNLTWSPSISACTTHGLDAARQILRDNPKIKILFLDRLRYGPFGEDCDPVGSQRVNSEV